MCSWCQINPYISPSSLFGNKCSKKKIERSPSDLHIISISGQKDVTIRLLWDCDNFLCTEFRLQSDWRSFIVFFCIRCTRVFSHLLMMMLVPSLTLKKNHRKYDGHKFSENCTNSLIRIRHIVRDTIFSISAKFHGTCYTTDTYLLTDQNCVPSESNYHNGTVLQR